jgi:hypothetical protein
MANQFAGGVDNFGGGMAIVGERGPELVNLPAGSSVFSNGKSRDMLSGGAGIAININITGNTLLNDRDADRLADTVGTAILQRIKNERNI